jgi:phage terminase large subunit-like protein
LLTLPVEAEEVLDFDEIEAWCDLLDEIEADPEFLLWLEAEAPQTLHEFELTLRNIHSLSADKLWRLSDGTPGCARPPQLMPGTPGSASDRTDWRVWLILAGRGSGKSFAAAQAVRELLTGREWQQPPRFALVSATLEGVRQDMIEGVLLRVLGPLVRRYNRSTLEIFLHNGAHLKGYSSERPDRLRGPNFIGAWADEISSWLDADHAPSEDSTWSNLEFATRADDSGTWEPRIIATTTPKPVRLLRVADQHDDFYPGLADDSDVVVTRMRTHDNLGNLAKGFARRIISRYQGTRLASQELDGELLDEIEGALWTMETIEKMRSTFSMLNGPVGGYHKVYVAVDPTVGDGNVSNDECGIIVGCLGADGNVWILEDATVKGPPSLWCRVVGEVYQRWNAEKVIVEKNQGGNLLKETLNRYWDGLPIATVWGREGKRVRAEGPALLCEQGEVKLACSGTVGRFELLCNQLTTWDPVDSKAASPDRLDTLCLRAATPVLTPAGEVRLDRIRPGDLVWTRSGWKPVLAQAMTGVRPCGQGSSVGWPRTGWNPRSPRTHRARVGEP